MKKLLLALILSAVTCSAATYSSPWLPRIFTNYVDMASRANPSNYAAGVFITGGTNVADGYGGWFWPTNSAVGTNLTDLVADTRTGWAWRRLSYAKVATGVGITNIGNVYSANVAAGSNIAFTTNSNGQLSIASTASGTSVLVNGATVSNPNFTNSTTALIQTAASTNVSVYPTNLTDAQISGSAAIARSKVAAGTASHVVINDGSGNLSSEATLGAARFPALTGDVTTPGGSLATTIAANAVTSGKILDGAVTTAKLADNAVTGAKMSTTLVFTNNARIPNENNLGSGTNFVFDPLLSFNRGTATGNFYLNIATNAVSDTNRTYDIYFACYDATGFTGLAIGNLTNAEVRGYALTNAVGTNNYHIWWSGGTWHIEQDSAKSAVSSIQMSATQRFIGRNTAGAGAGEEVSLTQALDWVGSAAQGDLLYRGSSSWTRLGAGTSGQYLQTQGAAANPQWATVTIPTGANPTASVGLTAVNGSASTFMRSDGAPALSQSIAPTWTGAHIFQASSGVPVTITGNSGNKGLVVNGGSTTGSSTNAVIDISGTLNTSGLVDFFLINITNTASGGGTRAFAIQVGGTEVFAVNMSGGPLLGASANIAWTGMGRLEPSGVNGSFNIKSSAGVMGILNTGAITLVNPTADTTTMAISGGSTTGSGTTKAGTFAHTANTSGNIDGVWTFAMTDTASGSTTKILNILGGAAGTTSEFSVDKSGNLTSAGGITIAGGQVFATTGRSSFKAVSGNNGFQILSGSGTLDLIVDASAELQLGSDAASATAQKLKAHDGSGTDKAGANLTLAGGQSTGSGTPGDFITQTSLTGTTGSSANSYSTRQYVRGKYVDLTESTATLFANIALSSGKYMGAKLFCTVTANDGTDYQALSSVIHFSAVNKAGTIPAITVTQTDGTPNGPGTLTATYTAVVNGNAVDIKCNAVSSLTQTVLRVKWILEDLNSDDVGTVVGQ